MNQDYDFAVQDQDRDFWYISWELWEWLRISDVANRYDCFYARLPLDEKLFERDLQAALQLSKQSPEDDTDAKTGLMKTNVFLLLMSPVFYSYAVT